jgi:hypothetical protein
MRLSSFTGFLCSDIGGVFSLLNDFTVIFFNLFSVLIIRRRVVGAEFIIRYSASQLLIIFMLIF